MTATPPPPPPAAPRRPRRKAAAPLLSEQVLEVLGELATVSPTVAEVAAELGVMPAALGGVIAYMEHGGKVEVWPCPDRPGVVLVMLSATAATQRGLSLSARGKRWIPASA